MLYAGTVHRAGNGGSPWGRAGLEEGGGFVDGEGPLLAEFAGVGTPERPTCKTVTGSRRG